MSTSLSTAAAPFRAQPIGSMVRPAELLEARSQRASGQISWARFKQIEDRWIDDALKIQEDAGLDIVTDGELRRSSFEDSLFGTLEGFSTVAAESAGRAHIGGFEHVSDGKETVWHTDHGDETIIFDSLVTDRVHQTRSPAVEEFTYLRARTALPIKITLPSPTLQHWYWSPKHSRRAYPEPFDFFTDLAGILRHEVEELERLGCEYIQIDAPEFTDLVDADTAGHMAQLGLTATDYVNQGVDLINGMFEGIDGIRVGLHLCRANWSGRWLSSGGYEHLTSTIFQRAHVVDEFLLEFDDARSGGFEPLASIPDGKCVILGLATTKSNELETVGELVARVEEAAAVIPLDRLGVSPACGFSCTNDSTPISLDAQQQKLRVVGELARQIWN